MHTQTDIICTHRYTLLNVIKALRRVKTLHVSGIVCRDARELVLVVVVVRFALFPHMSRSTFLFANETITIQGTCDTRNKIIRLNIDISNLAIFTFSTHERATTEQIV
jgi:hypothetical protein